MAALALLSCVLSALALALSGSTTTHWLVAEKGLIQPREDPSFELRRPYDLLAFLQQDVLRDDIIQIYFDLTARRRSIHELWAALEKATNLSELVDETTCFSSLNLYPSVVDSIRRDDVTMTLISRLPAVEVKNEPPDCSKFSSLPFSMFTFEHLQGMRNRDLLSMTPDINLPVWVLPTSNTDAFGHQISAHLRRDGASWLHYALASVYWKVIGDAYRAMECSRRAVLYAPREYKDIVLVSMGNIFHRSQRGDEALMLFQAAVDHMPEYGINRFALANALAAAGYLNESLAEYAAAASRGAATDVQRNWRAAHCQVAVLEQAHSVEILLRQIQENVTEYRLIEFTWWNQQAKFLNALQYNEDDRFADTKMTMNTICNAMENVMKLKFCNLKKEGDRNYLIQLFLGDSVFPSHFGPAATVPDFVGQVVRQMKEVDRIAVSSELYRAMDGTIKFNMDLHHTSHVQMSYLSININHKDSPKNDITAEEGAGIRADPDFGKNTIEHKTQSEFSDFEGGTVLYPPTYEVNRLREPFDTMDEWPTKALCDEWAPRFPALLDTVYPVFLPFQNKGLIVKGVLSERIGLTLQEEHPLPWHPPVCSELKGSAASATATALPRLPKSAQQGEGVSTERLRPLLLQYVADGPAELAQHMHEAEVGQRILTAHKKKVAPKWLLYTLSSLYWRVRRNNANALTCLASATRLAPARFRDIVHTSLASVLLEVGYVEEALSVATQAYRLSSHEPATNFLLSLIHMVKNNRAAHVFHMRQTVRAEPEHADGLARALLYAWSCKMARSAADEKAAEESVCRGGCGAVACTAAEMESCPRPPPPLHVFHHHGYKLEEEISAIVRLVNLKPHSDDTDTDEGSLERLGEGESKQQQLQQRYRLLDKMLKNCGEEDCSNMYPVKAREVQGSTCFFQHLRFWHWLPYLRLDTLLQERGIRLNEKLKLEQQSRYKFPDCRAPHAHGDPTLEWLSRVQVDGWRPLADLVEEIASLLGQPGGLEEVSAMLAHHVERGGSWLGFLVAGLWCGGFARGACCLRCFAAAVHAAPPRHRDVPLLSLVAVLHLQDKVKEAKHAAYLALPLAPKSKLHLFVAGISHTYVGEYEAAIRMFRAALTQEPSYAVARACLQATMCLVLFVDDVSAGHQ